MSDFTPTATGTGLRARVQRGGAFLAGMVMPNLGAFIAFGLITALFIPTGWVNQIAGTTENPVPVAAQISSLVSPLIAILIPLLIGYTGGHMVHGRRGAVVGAVGTLGAMLSAVALGLAPLALSGDPVPAPASIAEISPNILGAFVMGPLTAWLLKKWDGFIEGKVRGGFEMLVDNFSAGIIGGGMAVFGLYVIGWVTFWIAQGLGLGADWLIENNLLPLSSIIIEPAKILFLNNAIGNGILVPLGSADALADGKSVLFMLESNPGPGLGLLAAMLLFGPRAVRPTVPAAMVVHFLGGIHEIYFPYVLMKPLLFIAAILGGASGVLVFTLTGVGLVGPASPGSIIAYLLVSPGGDIPFILLGILVSAAVAFAAGAVLLGFGRSEKVTMDLDEAKAQSKANKNKPAQASA